MKLFSNRERPVFREIFISDENRKLRIILLCVFLGIAVVAIGAGITDFLNVDPGWQEVEALADGVNCAQDFTFQYCFSNKGSEATLIQKDLVAMYSDATEKAYWMFTPDQPDAGNTNVYAINHSVGKEVSVDPVLYHALSTMEESGMRYLYLGPVYAYYDNIFYSADEVQAQYWDPTEPENAQYLQELAGFVRDENSVRLEFLGDNRVRLQVSEEYAAFARENEIENFIDFHWMRNAFIIDYFAKLCLDKGYTDGYIVSWDGYTRNLSEGTDFSFNLFNRVGSTIFPAGTMVYNVPTAIVALRDYPMLSRDTAYYHTGSQGVISCHLDPRDGANRCAATDLVSYSTGLGCGDILMRIAPVYITAELDEQALTGLAETGIESIWYEDFVIRHTQKDLRVVDVLNQEDCSYTVEKS